MTLRTKKILCFLDNDSGRDVEIVLPLIHFAQSYLNAECDFSLIWDIHAIRRKKPDIVLLPNTVGSKLYFEISKYAHENGIKVFALISEGNLRTDGTFDYWGYNVDKQFYQDYICCWSERTMDFLRSELPHIKDRIVFTGATGFDRYSIYDFESQEAFLKKRNLERYRKVIGYAGWAFGKLTNDQGILEILGWAKGDKSRLKWVEEQRVQVEQLLKTTIENNPDTLFILKKHPNEENPSITIEGKNEMNGLIQYPNVLYIKDRITNIHDLISVSDIWMSFESTTAMEAWLMGNKPTIFINPDPDFNRDPTYKGTAMVANASQLQLLIDEFYETGAITKFDDPVKAKERESIFYRTIGYGDGMNHARAARYLKRTINSVPESNAIKPHFVARHLVMYMLMHLGKLVYHKRVFLALPKFRKTTWIFDNWRLNKTKSLLKKYAVYLDAFYEKQNIEAKMKDW